MAKCHDLTIVGTGASAMVSAMQARAVGWTVAAIYFQPFGRYTLRRCDPKSILVSGAEASTLMGLGRRQVVDRRRGHVA